MIWLLIWDWVFVVLTYNSTQTYPAPCGMRKYELIDPESDCLGSEVFLCEPLWKSIGPEIFNRGQRVKNYMALLKVVCHLVMMDRVLSVSDGAFNQCPQHFSMHNLWVRMICALLCKRRSCLNSFGHFNETQ
jgi:hypothetical protein